MPKTVNQNTIVALDIGTSKVVALVAEVAPDNSIEIIGVGSYPSKGLKRGVVVNIESTMQSIQRAIEGAELMAGCQIQAVYTGIAGNHIRSLNSHGIVAIRESEVVHSDIDRVIDAAKAVAIPADQKILHILPQEFIIDEQSGIREPIGMSGVRLEAKVHMVTGAVSAAQNIIKCINGCGLDVSDIILQPLASSYAVLSEDEKDLGVCLIDIGGGTTDIAIFTDGAIRHTAVIPIAGDHVSGDIAVALRTPTSAAEKIKIEHASLLHNDMNTSELIQVPSASDKPGREIGTPALYEVVNARYVELFRLVQKELRRSGFEELVASGIVLTGGASKMLGACELAESIFAMPVRLGTPQHVMGVEEVVYNPVYATSIGLLLYAQQQQANHIMPTPLKQNMRSVFGRMRNWLQGNW